ncbi:type II secretion system secretin GspD [Roseateles amylovorans]|uniref:Type IV pilus biogenesis and competence protein PilQ n=1 Tax=Roseateles amylovorans TaxID=2978473 RepID=A0ABY6B2A7_9BURK|nr:type II secretion system secretin GspD [Roseateles amylovorans]UXH79314.1 type II secretion system secretin GspD [Roseateles amylovorans]
MNKHLMRPTALSLAIALIATSLPLQAQTAQQQTTRRQPAVRPSTPVTLNFVNTDIEAVSRAMSAALGKPILVDPRVKGTMTLTAEQPVPVQEAYLSYLASLRGLGFAMVDAGGLLKLVPEAEAKLQTGSVTIGTEARQRGDQIVTQIFKLNHENANNLVAVLRPLITPNNTINANPGNNSLVITDYAENLQRISRIVAAMDQPSNTDIEVIPLRNAVAADIVQLVQRLSDGGSGGGNPGVAGAQGGGTSVLADPRSNSLIVRATNPAKLMQLRAMIAKLDQPGVDAATGNIRVIYLKNADAVRLATVLRAAFTTNNSGGGGGGSAGASSSTGSFAGAQTGSSGGGGGSFAGNSSSFGGGSSGSSGGSGSTGASTQVAAQAQVNTGGFVQADPATNSLIITAPEPMYRQIRAVVEQLDTRRAQIYVEALIVKVDASKTGQFGVQLQQVFGDASSSVISALGTNFGTTGNILTLSAATVSGTTSSLAGAVGSVSPGLNLGFLKKVGSYYTLGAIANVLEQASGTNVLSTPSLVVQDNEEADLLIGRNVPVLSGSYSSSTSSSSSTVSPFATYERRDIGLRLKVKGQVGENGTVRMKVYQENSSVVDTATAATQGVTLDKSAVETSVTLEDGQVLVLGGLLKDDYSDGESKVPGLGDIPLLGYLFKTQNRTRAKSNLMIFLRPVVLRTPDSANGLTMDRYEAIRAYQNEVQPDKRIVLPNTGAPLLPEKPASSPLLPTPPTVPAPVPAPVPSAPVTTPLPPQSASDSAR